MRLFFWVSTTYVWLRGKKISFWLRAQGYWCTYHAHSIRYLKESSCFFCEQMLSFKTLVRRSKSFFRVGPAQTTFIVVLVTNLNTEVRVAPISRLSVPVVIRNPSIVYNLKKGHYRNTCKTIMTWHKILTSNTDIEYLLGRFVNFQGGIQIPASSPSVHDTLVSILLHGGMLNMMRISDFSSRSLICINTMYKKLIRPSYTFI